MTGEMQVGFKDAGQLSYVMTVQVQSQIKFGKKISQFRFILKIFLFSVWVSISEEKKVKLRCYTKTPSFICRFAKQS
jgi:hypothetical protein